MGNVSKEELSKMMATLKRQGLSDVDLRDLKKMASGHMDKNSGMFGSKSMSADEARHLLKDMREHPSWHHLSKDQIKKVEEEVKEDLND
ncbi:MAG: hypothetical protein G01um101470_32 [Parcubacteria group bacterium Gr01-1014_70]|nr:MAG: hypothetical protein G01um101470_32 [Parcubacteria group bacterium Gr01-1014_70]